MWASSPSVGIPASISLGGADAGLHLLEDEGVLIRVERLRVAAAAGAFQCLQQRGQPLVPSVGVCLGSSQLHVLAARG